MKRSTRETPKPTGRLAAIARIRSEVGRTELFAKLKEEMLIHERIEEEEGEMFKQACQVFETDELEALGARMMELKKARQEIGAA